MPELEWEPNLNDGITEGFSTYAMKLPLSSSLGLMDMSITLGRGDPGLGVGVTWEEALAVADPLSNTSSSLKFIHFDRFFPDLRELGKIWFRILHRNVLIQREENFEHDLVRHLDLHFRNAIGNSTIVTGLWHFHHLSQVMMKGVKENNDLQVSTKKHLDLEVVDASHEEIPWYGIHQFRYKKTYHRYTPTEQIQKEVSKLERPCVVFESPSHEEGRAFGRSHWGLNTMAAKDKGIVSNLHGEEAVIVYVLAEKIDDMWDYWKDEVVQRTKQKIAARR